MSGLARAVTERVGHCREMVKTLNVADWDAIVVFSGDGLVYEAVNGFCCRTDALHALDKCPIGVLPSGNVEIRSVPHILT